MIKNILVGTVLVLVMMASAGATEVKADPALQTVAAGDAFYMNVTVEDVVDLAADQAVLNFDPDVMQATGIIEGDFLKTVGSTLGVGKWDNTAGTATFSYSFIDSLDKVSGNGILGTIEFNTYPDAPAGTYDLSLTNVVLINVSDAEISTGTSNGAVTILSPTTATPTQTRTSTRDGGGSGIVIFDATGEGTADVNIPDTISSTPATTTPTTTTPGTITNVSVNATTDTPAPTSASTPSSVPGLCGIDVIAASGILTILFAIRKRKWK